MADEHKYEDLERDALFSILSETERLANVGGWEWDIVIDAWTFSDNWLRIHGCSKRHLATSELLPIAHPDDRQDIQQAFERAVNEGVKYEIEHRIIRQDTGEERYVRALGKPKLNSDGDTVKLYGSVQDITEKKMAEQSLKESEKRLKISTESGGVGLWELNLIDLTAWRSLTHDRIFGYESLLPEWTYEMFLDHVVEEDRPMVEKEFGKALKNKELWDFNCRINRKDGVSRWIHAKGKPEIDENQNPIKMYGTIQDITERKRLEEVFERERRLLQKAEQISDLGVWEWDIVNDRFEVSENWKRLHGIEKDSISSKELYTLAHPKDVTGIEALSQEVFQKKIPSYDHVHRIIRKNDGETRYVRALGEIFFDNDGKPIWMYGTTQDITESKKAEEALRESEEKYRQLFELESDAIFLINSETGKIIDANASAVALYGYSREKLLEMKNVDLSTEVEKTKQATQDKLSRIPIRYHQKEDGSVFPVEITASHLKWTGRDAHIAAIRDISFRVEAESAHEKLERELYQSQKMESIGTLAGGIAHEFNNMLAIIMGNNELIMEELPQYSLARESAEEIRIAGLRARDVVKQLLTFSRHDDSVKKIMDFKLVVQESMKLIRSTTPANIKIEQNLSADRYPVNGNDTQINQLLINLCNNAVDAMPEKGGIITIKLLNDIIDKHQASHQTKLRPGEYAKLIVSDNGIGMDKETLDRVFEPFFTTKDVGKGSGIGMAVVHGIVEKHGGAIIVDSKPGQGTAFTMFFPTYEGQFEQVADNQNDLPVGEECILYVDDESSIAHLGKRCLESLGYRTESTTDPLKALEMVKTDPHRFDLVITDMAMPNMTGDQLIVEILKIRQDMPTIICTGYSAMFSDKAKKIGASSFAMKPLAKMDLATTVRKVLDEAKNKI